MSGGLLDIPIRDLPAEITRDQAVELVYGADLARIEDKLLSGLSVLCECDKQLTFYLYRALRKRLKRRHGGALRLRLVTGHAPPPDGQERAAACQTVMQRMLRELQEAVFAGDPSEILCIPHLDILTTTTRSGLTADTREASALLYENPDAVVLAFKDPSFELPSVISSAFAARMELIGLPREALPRVILQREARKLAAERFNPMGLYKYVSGLNAVRLRQILEHLQGRTDYDPLRPESRDEVFGEIRRMTLTGGLEVPRVDLHDDIGGYKDVKDRIETEILELLRLKARAGEADLERVRHIEEIVPKGIILHGPPGTGKTLLAKAIATALDATITVVSGPELKSRWVGESEENLRRVFAEARRSAPAIIVFDELDSFAAARGTYTGSGVEHSMVNQLLTEMDGFRKEELVFVVGTTNYVECLDPALLRPGRFELKIPIPYPDAADRRAILDIYRRKFRLEIPDEIMDYLVLKTGGYVDLSRESRFSGDHLYAIARALKREQLRRGERVLQVTRKDADYAIRLRKESRVELTESEERTIAVHEAGHAVCAYVLPHCPTIETVTIATDDTDTLGYVMQAVRENRYVTTRGELLDDICVLLGGRVAEELLLSDASVGAYDDLMRATQIARVMIEELGMSDRLGVRSFGTEGSPGGTRPRIADRTAARIDNAIEKLLATERARAEKTLLEHRAELEALVQLLLERRSVGLDDIAVLFEPSSASTPSEPPGAHDG